MTKSGTTGQVQAGFWVTLGLNFGLATSLTYLITSLICEKFAGNDILWSVIL